MNSTINISKCTASCQIYFWDTSANYPLTSVFCQQIHEKSTAVRLRGN